MLERGRAETIERDRDVTATVVDHAATTAEQAVRVWQPHRQVAFGRRDAREAGFERATAAAEEHGYPATTRDVGGRAVAFSGKTVAFVRAGPPEDVRSGLQERYAAATAAIQRALAGVGVEATTGEPPGAFCPGSHSLQADGKIVGLAQRVKTDVAVVAGLAVVTDSADIATVLDPVYRYLGVEFEPDAVGSVAAAGGPGDPAVVADAIADELTGG